MTTSAVNPLHPLAIPKRVSAVLGDLVGSIGETTRPLVEHLLTPQDLSHA